MNTTRLLSRFGVDRIRRATASARVRRTLALDFSINHRDRANHDPLRLITDAKRLNRALIIRATFKDTSR